MAEGEKGPVGEIAAESYEDELNTFFVQAFRSLFGMVNDESVCAEFKNLLIISRGKFVYFSLHFQRSCQSFSGVDGIPVGPRTSAEDRSGAGVFAGHSHGYLRVVVGLSGPGVAGQIT